MQAQGNQYGAANEGYSFDYLKRYAAQDGTGDVYTLCLSVLGEVEDVLRYVLDLAGEA